jgi:hypothetical protein
LTRFFEVALVRVINSASCHVHVRNSVEDNCARPFVHAESVPTVTVLFHLSSLVYFLLLGGLDYPFPQGNICHFVLRHYLCDERLVILEPQKIVCVPVLLCPCVLNV